jgi:hypothetical protein
MDADVFEVFAELAHFLDPMHIDLAALGLYWQRHETSR